MLTQEKLERNRDKTPMPDSKIKAFMEEFPWILELLNPEYGEPVHHVYVFRAEPSLCDYHPYDPRTGRHDEETIYLLDKNGEELSVIEKRKKFGFFGPIISEKQKLFCRVEPGVSIRSVIGRLPVASQIGLILSYCFYTKTAIVYKLPKNMAVYDWWDKGVVSEKKKLQKELATIG